MDAFLDVASIELPAASAMPATEAKMATMFPRVYQSFEDFERNELRRLDQLYNSVDDAVDEALLAEVEDESKSAREDGILFDRLDD